MLISDIKVGMKVRVKVGTSMYSCSFWETDHSELLQYEGREGIVTRVDAHDYSFHVDFSGGQSIFSSDGQWFTCNRVVEVANDCKPVKGASTVKTLKGELFLVEQEIKSLGTQLVNIKKRIEESKIIEEYPFNFQQLSERAKIVGGVYLSDNGYELFVNHKGEIFYLGRVGIDAELQIAKPICWQLEKFKLTTKTLKLTR